MKQATTEQGYANWAKKSMTKKDDKVAMKKVHDILNDRDMEQRDEDVEELMELYQVAQRTMEKNISNLTDAWFVEKQMQDKLDRCNILPEDDMEQVRQLWKNSIKPAQTKLQALSVFIDPRTWEKVHSGDMTLDNSLIERAEAAYDLMVNNLDDTVKYKVNKSWLALRRSLIKGEPSIFNNLQKLERAKVIGPFQWMDLYCGIAHDEFVQHISKPVLTLCCNASGVERVNSMYNNLIGLRRNRMNNDKAEDLVYIYVNERALRRVEQIKKEMASADKKDTPIYALPELFTSSTSEHQDPDVYASLGHEAVEVAGEDFTASDAHHEFRDLMAGRDNEQEVADQQQGGGDDEEEPDQEDDLGILLDEDDDGEEEEDDDGEEEEELQELAERQAGRRTQQQVEPHLRTPSKHRNKRQRRTVSEAGRTSPESAVQPPAQQQPAVQQQPTPYYQGMRGIPGPGGQTIFLPPMGTYGYHQTIQTQYGPNF